MESIFDDSRNLDMDGIMQELLEGEMSGVSAVMARILAGKLFMDGRFPEAVDLLAGTVGWFFELNNQLQNEEAAFGMKDASIKDNWLFGENYKPLRQLPRKSLVPLMKQKLPPSWTVVIVGATAADESECVLMQHDLEARNEDQRGVGTALLARINKDGPSLMVPVRRPMDTSCALHSLIPVDPWKDSTKCEHCWNGYKSLGKIKKDFQILLGDETSKKEKSSETLQMAENRASNLVLKMKWYWLHDVACAILRGLPLINGSPEQFLKLRSAVLTDLEKFISEEYPEVQFRDEALLCIAHLLLELQCARKPSRSDGLILAIRDVILSYNYRDFNDSECYAVAEKIQLQIRTDEMPESEFLLKQTYQRGPVIFVLDKDYEGLPWESLTDLLYHPVTRAPSISYIVRELEKRSVDGVPRLDLNKLYYLLNPGNDLPKTMNRLKSIVEHNPRWKGCIGTEPKADCIVRALESMDIYAYFGHGNGQQYLRQEVLEKAKSRALIMLFGCASCAISPEGPLLEPFGIAYSYLCIGSIGVMGMLYPVTDKDCDEIAKHIFRTFLGVNSETGKPYYDMDFADIVANVRRIAICNNVRTRFSFQVFCLHGYRQTKETFREKTGAFRKLFKKKIEFFFMNAPHSVSQGLEAGDSTEQLGWYFNKEDFFKSSEPSDRCLGFDASLQAVTSFVADNGPFDGIVGFSQGAAFLGILCRLQEKRGTLNDPYYCTLEFSFGFAVFFSGFKSLCGPHAHYYTGDKIQLPTLHCYGTEDKIVAYEKSVELADQFQSPVLVSFPGGHFVPGNSLVKAMFVEFFSKRALSAEA
ncbi:unnamed protein product [Notodromas monacha]|uniref:separase n=1 Tax=Notodromas monacha TaxID=399045 RepID=A0A7R9BNH0_9CRUS|nr:unnamed protein product [Notodromas monacha]CAG0917919.1 unnamed protein product [Notodromas monacha]